MKIYDISQEVFGSVVFANDPAPKKETLGSIEMGDICNLTAFSMCAHNGTHVDAPYHFLNNGRTVDEVPLSKTVGLAYVAECEGLVTAERARKILERAGKKSADAARRILIKGKATVSLEAAKVFAEYGVDLIGNESQTVGPEDGPVDVHKVLLGADAVLLEGIRLGEVTEGVCFLCAAPLSLAGADGSPCRAIIIETPEYQ